VEPTPSPTSHGMQFIEEALRVDDSSVVLVQLCELRCVHKSNFLGQECPCPCSKTLEVPTDSFGRAAFQRREFPTAAAPTVLQHGCHKTPPPPKMTVREP